MGLAFLNHFGDPPIDPRGNIGAALSRQLYQNGEDLGVLDLLVPFRFGRGAGFLSKLAQGTRLAGRFDQGRGRAA